MTGGLVDLHYGLRIKRGSDGEVFVDCEDYIRDKCKELNIPAGNRRRRQGRHCRRRRRSQGRQAGQDRVHVHPGGLPQDFLG